jgi:hypothetical protein
MWLSVVLYLHLAAAVAVAGYSTAMVFHSYFRMQRFDNEETKGSFCMSFIIYFALLVFVNFLIYSYLRLCFRNEFYIMLAKINSTVTDSIRRSINEYE